MGKARPPDARGCVAPVERGPPLERLEDDGAVLKTPRMERGRAPASTVGREVTGAAPGEFHGRCAQASRAGASSVRHCSQQELRWQQRQEVAPALERRNKQHAQQTTGRRAQTTVSLLQDDNACAFLPVPRRVHVLRVCVQPLEYTATLPGPKKRRSSSSSGEGQFGGARVEGKSPQGGLVGLNGRGPQSGWSAR